MNKSVADYSASGPVATIAPLHRPYTLSAAAVLEELRSSAHGLDTVEARERLSHYGSNRLPESKAAGWFKVVLRQFLSPLIYVLLIAAVVSAALGEWSDAAFIMAVLLLNAGIGTAQEYSAERAALALQHMVVVRARVLRGGESYEIASAELVPGDVVLLESGAKVPADLRLLTDHSLEVDESLLTGESFAVAKTAAGVLAEDTVVGDRRNMAFAGTIVHRGRARGVVVATGLATELGAIASAVLSKSAAKPPLLVRMERFTWRIAMAVAVAVLALAGISLAQGAGLAEVFILAVALAVSAIPEGLPVALTVTLAIGMRRMAKRNVIVRKLVAVEALGSCTFIASDKTGTLTMNELTATRLVLPGHDPWPITGEGTVPLGTVLVPAGTDRDAVWGICERLCRAAALANEGFLAQHDNEWVHHGDAVDVALLALAHKVGVSQAAVSSNAPELASIEFESARMYAASLNQDGDNVVASVKGALERVLPMCERMATSRGGVAIDSGLISAQAHALARQGYRVIAVAAGEVHCDPCTSFSEEHLHGLTLLGLIGLIDPLRNEAHAAIKACRKAGIQVSMVTGDHPTTALSIARELELASDEQQVVTGVQLREAEQVGPAAVDALTAQARVFARVEPQQKLDIVRSLQRNGEFVAVTGDGANDAPALRMAQVGVAMGKRGTDVARETADIIITDDNFSSLVAGIDEGRLAYSNVRKVIFLLISTGAAEIVLFAFSMLFGLPLPLLAVQLLWLNLVTNGIQDIALAFEPAEGDELHRPPRPPREAIFNRIMIERVLLSAAAMGSVAFATFYWLLSAGYELDQARNGTLLLMVLFENIHVFNSRSETLSAFRHNPMRNRLLLFGTVVAQLVHIGAMYTPGLRDVLSVQPVAFSDWFILLTIALSVLVVMELDKAAHSLLRTRASGSQ